MVSSNNKIVSSRFFEQSQFEQMIMSLLENQMCRVIQELFQRWHVHRLKEQFDVSHARFDLEDDFFC